MANKDTKKDKVVAAKGILGNWIVRNLLLAVAVVVGLLLVAQLGLSLLTRHNRTVTVPDFTNMTVAEAQAYLEAGHFAEGSMAPKIRAAIYFLEHGGETCIITEAGELGNPSCGTRIIH